MLNQLWLRLKALVFRKNFDRDLQDEIAFHLAMKQHGAITDPAAREAALRDFGNATRACEDMREMRTFMFLETLWQDVRFGVRLLRKNPLFSVIAIATLAVGIGANTAIFSLTYQVMLQLLPVPEPKEMVILRSPGIKLGRTSSDGDGAASFSYPMYQQIRDQGGKVFSGLLARRTFDVSISGDGSAGIASGELVSGNYFTTLRVTPFLGRIFGPEDESATGANPVAILSYSFWTRHFGNDLSILNKQINVNGTLLTVVGVTRQDFIGVQLGESTDVFVPVTMTSSMTPNWQDISDHRVHWLAVLGRLQPGISRTQAQAALQTIFHPMLEEEVKLERVPSNWQKEFLARELLLEPGGRGRPILENDAGKPVLMLNSMVGLVLLIACANLASLLLAKGEARQKEIAVRISLGARRSRVLRQLLTEGLLLATAGGLLGVAMAVPLLRLILHTVPDDAGLSGLRPVLDIQVLIFAFVLSVFTTLLFALMPALRMVGVDPQTPLKEQATTVSGGATYARKWLIVSQIVLTTILLSGSGLFTQSLRNLQQSNLGLVKDRVNQFTISPELNHHNPAQSAALFNELQHRIAALPGVRSVSAAETRILADSEQGGDVTVEGYVAPGEVDMHIGMNFIAPDFFSTMQIPLLAGREIRESDIGGGPRVAIVNEKFAKRFFAGRNPLGQHISLQRGNVKPDIEVVGVVANSKNMDSRDPMREYVYMPLTQDSRLGRATFYVRSALAPSATTNLLRSVVSGVDPALPLFNEMTLNDQVNNTNYGYKMLAILSSCIGSLAAVLAAMGLYGVMAYMVARRTREIGIRMALGASRESVAWMILEEVMRLILTGLAVGVVGAVIAGHFAESELYGVKGYNPLVLIAASALLATVGMLAGSLPARRAARVHPMIALRHE